MKRSLFMKKNSLSKTRMRNQWLRKKLPMLIMKRYLKKTTIKKKSLFHLKKKSQ
jgi:hypothetical protein